MTSAEETARPLRLLAEDAFTVVTDAQRRWVLPPSLHEPVVLPDGRRVYPRSLVLTDLFARLAFRCFPAPDLWQPEALRRLAECGTCPIEWLSPEIVRGLLRTGTALIRSGGGPGARADRPARWLELTPRLQLRRQAVLGVLSHVPVFAPAVGAVSLRDGWRERLLPLVAHFVDLAAFAVPRRRGRQAVARALATLLADGWGPEGLLRPVLPHLTEPEAPGFDPVVQRVATFAGPPRRRGNRFELRLDLEQALGFLRSGYPELDLARIEAALAPWAAALLAARDAPKPQASRIGRVLAAMPGFRQGPPAERTVGRLAALAALNRRPSVVRRYVGLGLLAERIPDAIAPNAAEKVRHLRRAVLGSPSRTAGRTPDEIT